MDDIDELCAPVTLLLACNVEHLAHVDVVREATVHALRQKVLFPTHVVRGKVPACVFSDLLLERPTGSLLKPGTKVECVCEIEGALKVNAGIAGHGWLAADQVLALPAIKGVGTCRCCRSTLPPSSFSKTNFGQLQKGQPASCISCQKCALSASALCHLVHALASLVHAVDLHGWCAFVGLSAERLALASKAARDIDWASFSAAAAAWWLWAWVVMELREKEPDLKKKPLKVVADHCIAVETSRIWQFCVRNTETRSFSSFLRNPFRADQLADWWEAAVGMKFWRQPLLYNEAILPREAAWFVRPGCTCSYEYGGTFWPPLEMPEWLLQIEETVWEAINIGLCGSRKINAPNSCVLNHYLDGSHFVDWHADDEPLFEGVRSDCLIVSLSLGASRVFEMRRRKAFGPHRSHVSIELCNGDIVTMEGLFQKYWQHRIPRSGKAGPRINMTWRTITAHCQSCPLAK